MPKLLALGDLCDALQVCEDTLRSWIKSGRVPPPLKVGKLLRWQSDTISAWLARGCPRVSETR
jgi:predicted DNA-binding transcriptional regulator AlpA